MNSRIEDIIGVAKVINTFFKNAITIFVITLFTAGILYNGNSKFSYFLTDYNTLNFAFFNISCLLAFYYSFQSFSLKNDTKENILIISRIALENLVAYGILIYLSNNTYIDVLIYLIGGFAISNAIILLYSKYIKH